jgi:cytochrome bd ubiquinol oxidase subunit II
VGLPELWFVIIAVLWVGFFVLEGFDFGVGMLHRFVGRSEVERRVAINTIGPFWDGNEVWLIVGGAAIFAAFPDWYATWFSASYLAVVLLLLALIARGVSFEFRGKVDRHGWRGTWSGALAIGSLVAPLVLGVALGDLVAGLPIGSDGEYDGDFWDLFTPYGTWTGITLVVLCLLHGATFLSLKTTGKLRDRSHRVARVVVWVALGAVLVFAGWTLAISEQGWGTIALLALTQLAVLAALWTVGRGRDGRAFVVTAAAIAGTVGSLFATLYPNVLVSSSDPANNLTIQNAASGSYALTVMSVVALIFFPLVLLYQGWAYVVFRRRLRTPGGSATGQPSVTR